MTQRFLLPALLAIAAAAPTGAAAQAADSRLASHQYNPDEIIKLEGKLNVQTTIAFGADEHIENVAVGDSDSWQIMPNRRADLLFIKPLSENARTNMTVVTDRHTYYFDLVASPASRPVYALRFAYAEPRPVVPALAATAPVLARPEAPVTEPALAAPLARPVLRVPAPSPATVQVAVPAQAAAATLPAPATAAAPAISPAATAQAEARRIAAEREAARRAEARRKTAERTEARRLAAAQDQARQAEAKRVKAERDAARRLAAQQQRAAQAEADRLKAAADAARRAEASRIKSERDATRRAEAERAKAASAATRRAQAEAAVARRAEAARLRAAAQSVAAQSVAAPSNGSPAPVQGGATRWKRSGSRELLPQRIQDDGRMTYAVWPAGRPIPQLLTVDGQGRETALPFTIEGEAVIIAGRPDRIILRSGKAMAVLEREQARPARGAPVVVQPSTSQPGR